MHDIHALIKLNHVHIKYAFTHSLTLSLSLSLVTQDKQVAQWLRILMRDGQSAIDEFIANPASEKQRRLALNYQQAVELAEDERTALQ